jgi:hypothetical protein
MDISKIKELHSQITKLKNKAEATDSKRETREIQMQIDNLENELEDLVYNSLKEIPEEIDVRIQTDKVVSYDTYEFKDYIMDMILTENNLENLDINRELLEYIQDSYDLFDAINNSDLTISIDDDRYK